MWLTGTQNNDFVTLKESHVVEIVLTAAARVKRSVRAPFSMLFSFSPSKMTFTENCFLQGDFDNRLPFGVEKKSGLSESWWISWHCPMWCAHVIYVFRSPTQLSSALGIWMSSTDEYKSVICKKHTLRSPPRSVMMAQPHPLLLITLNNGNKRMRLPSLDLDSGSETYSFEVLLFYSSVLDPVVLQRH